MTSVPQDDSSARTGRSARARFLGANRAWIGTLGVFVVMMLVFMVAAPNVFTQWPTYNSVLVTLPVALFLVVPLVFIVVSGEIDLSFPATMGFAAWIFALLVQAGLHPFPCHAGGRRTGMALGLGVGAIVVYAGLSSLVATLGLSFLLRGLILILTEGMSISLPNLRESWVYTVFSARSGACPSRSSGRSCSWCSPSSSSTGTASGARVRCVGDNPESASQMGINTRRVRVWRSCSWAWARASRASSPP
jgi:simple sugar transport system permease protein